jgi:DNA-binding NtrC family response regulator
MGCGDTILIVGDEINLRTTLAAIFQRAGYAITTSCSPKEALQHLGQRGFDLVFLDLKMPNRSGINLLHELKCRHPAIPVIILTASASSETTAKPYQPGTVGYLLKPIDPAKIVAYAEEVLTKNRQI